MKDKWLLYFRDKGRRTFWYLGNYPSEEAAKEKAQEWINMSPTTTMATFPVSVPEDMLVIDVASEKIGKGQIPDKFLIRR